MLPLLTMLDDKSIKGNDLRFVCLVETKLSVHPCPCPSSIDRARAKEPTRVTPMCMCCLACLCLDSHWCVNCACWIGCESRFKRSRNQLCGRLRRSPFPRATATRTERL